MEDIVDTRRNSQRGDEELGTSEAQDRRSALVASSTLFGMTDAGGPGYYERLMSQ